MSLRSSPPRAAQQDIVAPGLEGVRGDRPRRHEPLSVRDVVENVGTREGVYLVQVVYLALLVFDSVCTFDPAKAVRNAKRLAT